MAFGSIKADNIIYDDGTGEVTASVQSLANAGASITANAADIATNTTNIATNTTNIATKAPLASPQFTGTAQFRGDTAGGVAGHLQLNCSSNSHSVKIEAPPHANATNYTLTLPNDNGAPAAGTTSWLTTGGSGILGWTAFNPSTKADINSPTFTGTPALTTTPADTTNDQTIADCQFVGARINKLEGTWTAINSATNLVIFTQYLLDSTSGVFTVTLPASPSIGDVITLADQTGQYSTNNVTVARNGNNINGGAADLVLDVDRSVVRLIWSGNATVGWLVK